MFIFKVIRIFFRNKSTEIKEFFKTIRWYDIVEALITLGIFIVFVSLLFGIVYGTGYMLMDVLDWVDITFEGAETIPYAAIGIFFYIGVGFVVVIGFGVLQFFKWIWINIKMAIAEAKELTR